MNTKTITSIVPKSLALNLAVVYAQLGAIISFIIVLFKGQGLAYSIGYIVGAILTYAIMGLFFGWLTAITYNFAVKKVGGIQVTVE